MFAASEQPRVWRMAIIFIKEELSVLIGRINW